MAVMPEIDAINANLAKLADGRSVRFLNVNDKLADAQGTLFEGMAGDKLHPTLKGYQVWADGLTPILTELLGPRASTDLAPPPTGDPSARPRPAPQPAADRAAPPAPAAAARAGRDLPAVAGAAARRSVQAIGGAEPRLRPGARGRSPAGAVPDRGRPDAEGRAVSELGEHRPAGPHRRALPDRAGAGVGLDGRRRGEAAARRDGERARRVSARQWQRLRRGGAEEPRAVGRRRRRHAEGRALRPQRRVGALVQPAQAVRRPARRPPDRRQRAGARGARGAGRLVRHARLEAVGRSGAADARRRARRHERSAGRRLRADRRSQVPRPRAALLAPRAARAADAPRPIRSPACTPTRRSRRSSATAASPSSAAIPRGARPRRSSGTPSCTAARWPSAATASASTSTRPRTSRRCSSRAKGRRPATPTTCSG